MKTNKKSDTTFLWALFIAIILIAFCCSCNKADTPQSEPVTVTTHTVTPNNQNDSIHVEIILTSFVDPSQAYVTGIYIHPFYSPIDFWMNVMDLKNDTFQFNCLPPNGEIYLNGAGCGENGVQYSVAIAIYANGQFIENLYSGVNSSGPYGLCDLHTGCDTVKVSN